MGSIPKSSNVSIPEKDEDFDPVVQGAELICSSDESDVESDFVEPSYAVEFADDDVKDDAVSKDSDARQSLQRANRLHDLSDSEDGTLNESLDETRKEEVVTKEIVAPRKIFGSFGNEDKLKTYFLYR